MILNNEYMFKLTFICSEYRYTHTLFFRPLCSVSNWFWPRNYEGVSKSFRTESLKKYTLTTTNTRWEATQRVMAARLTRQTHKIAIQLHLVAESCTMCSSRSRRPVRKLVDTPSYLQHPLQSVIGNSSYDKFCVNRYYEVSYTQASSADTHWRL